MRQQGIVGVVFKVQGLFISHYLHKINIERKDWKFGLDICWQENNYHDSLQACLIEGIGQKNEDQVSVSQSDTNLKWPTWLFPALYDCCIAILAAVAIVFERELGNDWALGYELRYMLDQPLFS